MLRLRTISPHLSYTQNSIIATRFFPSLNYIVFSSFPTLPLLQSPNPPNSAKLLLFSSLSIRLKFNSVLNITSYQSSSKLKSGQPLYLCSLLNVQSNHTTRSSDIITHPSIYSYLKAIDRPFTHHTPGLWNSLPKQLRQL